MFRVISMGHVFGMGSRGGAIGAELWHEACLPGQTRRGRGMAEGRKVDQTHGCGRVSGQVFRQSAQVFWLGVRARKWRRAAATREVEGDV